MENEEVFEARATDRLILFSDAVVAIAITLLALELPVPAGRDASEFWTSVREHDGHYLAFLISFLVIAASWGGHHRIFRAVVRIDAPLRMMNMAWLLMIILNPLATKMLTTEDHDSLGAHALRYGFYALLQVLASLALLALSHHLTTHHLRAEEFRTPSAARGGEQLYGIILGFGLSIPVFFLTPDAWALWIAGPLLTNRLYHPWRTRRDRLRNA
ncbi:TMEM175 family protein [Streptomyces sp. NBC_01476]|uniref:TMEM175 family protein n=1 Tax=Streptomyces sp. NBC_01476 TaxID=2903881 RepID=UPI002E32583C|nr:TMEM175 family protein [Streptomyces sp. NBC_01476]